MSKSPKLQVKRHAERGKYGRDDIISILDDGYLVHIGFFEDGLPYVMPTLYARIGEMVYIHAATGNRLMGLLRNGETVCLEVTLADGIVLADSLFSHSMNYRSVMLFGQGQEVKGLDEKSEILIAFSEKLVPGRGQDARVPSKAELKQTGLFGFNIDTASAKVRTGPPSTDEGESYQSSWTGVIPLKEQWGTPIPSERCSNAPLPKYIHEHLEKSK